MYLICTIWLLAIQSVTSTNVPDLPSKANEERTPRAWMHPAPGSPPLQPNQVSGFQQTSTNQPADGSANDPNGAGRNFEDQDKTAVPAASEQDFLSRHYGYMNVHRFDPNFPYFDRPQYPRYPSPHSPRFGPGYRKDKYGHGYGYSCKQGDDCDEVRAANQIPPLPPPHAPPHHLLHPHHNMPPTPYNNPFLDVPGYSSIPAYPGHSSFPPFAGQAALYPPSPARFNDPHLPLPQMPSRFLHGRYLHDKEEGKSSENAQEAKTE